ncbi:MAG: hypothetical protein IT228_03000 [Flavobacteriales bacterium]|nr:hypothetical protein [Flavobacteriales bacterium]MCC6576288.1 hypothetical protein [Flavobacteriales bacterium]NUQ15277.1 hypothetical protein [Flavobacteriales bacterium]
MLRIFVCTSHLSAVFMTHYATRTRHSACRDVLIIDIGVRRASVVRAIREVATLHPWSILLNLSDEATEDHAFQPSLSRRLIRQWKEAPLVRDVYGALLKWHQRRYDQRMAALLKTRLGLSGEETTTAIHIHTECQIARALLMILPGSEVHYFEHGQGDYIYQGRAGLPQGTFHALFAAPFRRYLEAQGRSSAHVQDLGLGTDLHAFSQRLLELHGVRTPETMADARPVVFVLLEALDMYNVPEGFWGAYMDRVIDDLERPRDHLFVLKPHPNQSPPSLAHTLSRLRERGIDHLLLAGEDAGISAEVGFAAWAPRVRHVYCIVSSACFYLSALYPDDRITYHYSLDLLGAHIGQAPPMYTRLFRRMQPLITEVFAEHCVPY